VDIDFIQVFRISFSYTIAEELARTKYTAKTQTVAGSYATGAGNDSVIYHLTTYNCYKYEIISHPFDPDLVGTYMTIDVPDPPRLYQAPITYFDNQYDLDIGAETFNHTVGRPWTYPAKDAMLELAPQRWQSGEMSVGLGDGWNHVMIKVEEEETTTMTRTESSEYSAGVAVAGVGFTQSCGAFESQAYEILTGAACVYEGVVGQIANATRWEQLHYTFGLFVYYQTHPKGPTYQVVNYWVEGAVPYGIPPQEKLWDFFRQGQFLDLEFWMANPLYVAGGVGVLALLLLLLRSKGEKRKRRAKK